MLPDAAAYVGQELHLFAEAVVWKRYWARHVRRYLGRRVLEVGTGIGGSTRALCDGSRELWLGLEPDPGMAANLREAQARGEFPACCEFRQGTVADLRPDESFDSVLYIDVLEHIRADSEEVERSCAHLASGGHLVVVAPAHQSLYTEFDRAIGHYRRYDRRSLRSLTPAGMQVRESKYLDAVGLLASAGNRLLLRSSMPSQRQIWLWDRVFVRLSRWVDPILGYSVGKSVVQVWQRA